MFSQPTGKDLFQREGKFVARIKSGMQPASIHYLKELSLRLLDDTGLSS